MEGVWHSSALSLTLSRLETTRREKGTIVLYRGVVIKSIGENT